MARRPHTLGVQPHALLALSLSAQDVSSGVHSGHVHALLCPLLCPPAGGRQTPTGLKAIADLKAVYANWVPEENILTTNLWYAALP